MSAATIHDIRQEMPVPCGHVIGFIDSQTDCDAVTRTLLEAGYPESSITELSGQNGIQLLKTIITGSDWGEAFENVVKQGADELDRGHRALIIDAEDRDQAVILANVATVHGGHGFSYFGFLEGDAEPS